MKISCITDKTARFVHGVAGRLRRGRYGAGVGVHGGHRPLRA